MLTVEEQIRLIADAAMGALDPGTAERRATPREPVLDHMPVLDTSSPSQFTEDVVTMIDVKTMGPTKPRRKRPMRVVVAGLAAAAAVVTVTFVVIRDPDDVTPTDVPSTTVLPTPFFGALPDTDCCGRLVPPGTYFIDEVDGSPTARIFFTVGAGWNKMNTSPYLVRPNIGYITFSRAERVFTDACHWSDGYYPGPVANLDDFVAALSAQGGWADVTGPSDISIDGYAGKAFQRTAPAELSGCSTMPLDFSPHIRPPNWGVSPLPVLRSWQYGPEESDTAGERYEPGEIETLWVLDIDGTVVVINTRLWPSVTTDYRARAGPSAAALADFAAVLDSIRIDRG